MSVYGIAGRPISSELAGQALGAQSLAIPQSVPASLATPQLTQYSALNVPPATQNPPNIFPQSATTPGAPQTTTPPLIAPSQRSNALLLAVLAVGAIWYLNR